MKNGELLMLWRSGQTAAQFAENALAAGLDVFSKHILSNFGDVV